MNLEDQICFVADRLLSIGLYNVARIVERFPVHAKIGTMSCSSWTHLKQNCGHVRNVKLSSILQ
jgi:hypothetical protein